jgi:heptosyltransferase-2
MKSPRVLVIRLSSLGDVVLTAPVFRALRQAWPQAHLAVLVKDRYADVLAQNPDLDERLEMRAGESLLSLIRRVRVSCYDVVIDLHSNLRSHLISLFSGAPRRVRYRKAALARRLFVKWRRASEELHQHTLDRYWKALQPLGISIATSVPARAQKMLLIQTAFLGDAVLTTPLLSALRQHNPAAAISVVCTPEIAEVFKGHPAVSELILYDKRGGERSLASLWRLAWRLRQQRFDIAFLPHRSFRSALLAWLSRIPRRVGFSSSQGRFFLTDVIPFHWGVHDADRNLALLHAVGVRVPSGDLWIQPEPEAREKIERRLQARGVSSGDSIVGFNVGSVWPTKRWLPEGFAAVADRVSRELGAQVVFFGSDADQTAVADVLRVMKSQAINWVGQTSLRELIAAIAHCRVFLTNDSGPMHIAVAAHVPTVAIFGPTTKELGFFPYGDGHVVIERDLPCRPCGLHGAKRCPLDHFRCMKDISPEEVFAAVAQQFHKAATGPVTSKPVLERVQSA